MRNYIQIQTTFESKADAEKIAAAMLDAGLVACGQISEIESRYNWDGKRCKGKEFLLKMKTRAALYGECEKFIKTKHPYKCPQIIAIEIAFISNDYAAWIGENTKGSKE